jgi:linoleoyl-CoA desaturase
MQIQYARKQPEAGKPDIGRLLKQAFDQYFETNKTTQYANTAMWIKVWGGLALWAATWFLVIFGNFSGWALVGAGILHGLTHLFIPFNISHDASHHAISAGERMNRLLSHSLDLIGVSSFFWNHGHNYEHHGYINVLGKDSNIEGYGLMRFSPDEKPKPHYRFQHLYALGVYALTTLNYVSLKDFKFALQFAREKRSIPAVDLIKLILFKVFYFTYMLVIPIMVLDVAAWKVIAFYLSLHLLLGWILSLVFLCGHLTEDAVFPEYETADTINETWTEHVIRTTGNFGLYNPVFTWLVGGINLHLVHHLYPRICHIHYGPLTHIAKKVLEENGYTFRYSGNFIQAIISHFRFLKKLGNTTHYEPALPYVKTA